MSSDFNEKDNINAEISSDIEEKSDAVVKTSSDDFDDLSVIDISSDVEYQLNKERTGIDVVKLEKNKSSRGLNSFDIFFVRFWAAIVSAITYISTGISKGFKKVFKKELPVRYVNAFLAAILIILVIIIVLAPFNLTVGDKSTVDIFSNSMIPIAEQTGGELRWGYVNKSGRNVIPCKFYDAEPFYNNVAFVKVDDTTWRLIGTNGKFKGDIKIKTDSADPSRKVFGDFNNRERRAWIIENGKYTFIKTSGSRAYGNVYYDYAESFNDGYAVVQQGSDWYFINGGGKKKSATYLEAKSFNEERAAVKKSSGWTFVDTKFNEVLKGDNKVYYDAVTSFDNGYAWVRIGNSVNLIDKDCKAVLPTEFVGMKPSDEDLRELGLEISK